MTLNTDFDLMVDTANRIDAHNSSIQSMLRSFIGRMQAIPRAQWCGDGFSAFQGVVVRWEESSRKLDQALGTIAETIRSNERVLREASDSHASSLNRVGGAL